MDTAAPGSTPGSRAPSPPFFRPGAETPSFDDGVAPGGAATSEGWLRRDAMASTAAEAIGQLFERLQTDVTDRLVRIEDQATLHHQQNLLQHLSTQTLTHQVINTQQQDREARQATAAVLKELGPMMEKKLTYV